MRDYIKRTILKTLKELNGMEIIPTLDDLYYSLDTSEIKKLIKRIDFDEVLDELIFSKEIKASSVEGINFIYPNDFDHSFINDLVNYRRTYKKEIKEITFRLEKLAKLPFILNISNFNLIPFIKYKNEQFYVFVKEESALIARIILRILFLGRKEWFNTVRIIEVNNLSKFFEEKHLQSAYKLANLHPIINKNNFYENLAYQNKWVFEILGNIPVSKISLNYKSTNKKEKTDSSFVTKLLNRFFKFFIKY